MIGIIGQIALGLAFASLLIVAYLLGQIVERKRAKQAADAEERRRALEEAARRKAHNAQPEWLRSNLNPGTAGFTIAAALSGAGCLGRSKADEPVFVLCARDKAASMTVRDWATLAERLGAKPAKTAEARELADRMEAWRERHGGGKIPD
jgi:hypothetical protein